LQLGVLNGERFTDKMNAILLLAVSFAAAANSSNDDAIKKELNKFQGTWLLVSAETDGKKTPDEVVKTIKVVIDGNKHTVYRGDEALAKEIPFQIDPTKDPKTVDDTLPDGRTIHGIYKLEGDTLTSCVAGVDKERPKEFTAKEGSGQTLRVFKRAKP